MPKYKYSNRIRHILYLHKSQCFFVSGGFILAACTGAVPEMSDDVGRPVFYFLHFFWFA